MQTIFFIPDFLSKLIFSHISAPKLGLAIIAFLVVRIIYSTIKGEFKFIFNLNFERKKSILELLKSLDEISFESNETKFILRELLENDIFQKQTGIRTGVEKRKKILKFYQEYDGEISLETIKDGYSYICTNKRQNIYVRYTTFEKIWIWILSILLSLAAISFIVTSSFLAISEINEEQKHIFLLVNLVVAVLSYFLSISIRKLLAAKKMKKVVSNSN